MLNETDLQTFNHAVALAKAGRKSMANEIIEELLRTNLTDVNLYLWYAYTTDDFTKAYNAIELARRYEPTNASVLQAESWLRNQFADNYRQQSAASTATVATKMASPTAVASRVKLKKMSGKMRDKVQAVLKPDEEVKWIGRRSFLHGSLTIIEVSSILMGSFALVGGLFLLSQVLIQHFYVDPLDIKNYMRWGLFLTITGAFLVTTFFVAVIARLSTIYVLTDRRAIIAKDILGMLALLNSYTRTNVKTYNTHLKQRASGYGDLIFATQVTKYSNRDPSKAYEYRQRGFLWRSSGLFGGDDLNSAIGSDGDIGIAEIGFMGVSNIEQVYSLFMETFDSNIILET